VGCLVAKWGACWWVNKQLAASRAHGTQPWQAPVLVMVGALCGCFTHCPALLQRAVALSILPPASLSCCQRPATHSNLPACPLPPTQPLPPPLQAGLG
jgi:hypothetical protein